MVPMTTDNKYWSWDDRINTVFGRDTFERQEQYIHWKMLRSANTDFKKHHPDKIDDYLFFMDWLQEKYGIRVYMAEGGYISGNFEITDEHKYLLFQIAYTR